MRFAHTPLAAPWPRSVQGKSGELRPGMLADLAVVDTDLLACDAEDILDAKVVATWMGGTCVYEA